MSRRGTILLTVLLVIVIASLVGAGSIYSARAEALSATVTLRRTQSRALAWSGVQALMSELAEQREEILDGQDPRITEEWELFEDQSVRAVVRLIPLVEGGPLLTSEAVRLNLNAAPTEVLTASGFDEKEAEAIIAARETQPLASVQDLLRIDGVSIAKLRGLNPDDPDAPERPLLDRLTVWSFDANIQSGLGNDGSRHRGKLRVNLDAEWSDRLAAAIDDRFGEGSSNIVKTLREKGTTFKSMADLITALNTLNVEPKDWPGVLDAFTTTLDPYIPGRIDLSRAPIEVLACIPGIDQAAAEQIVQTRDGLDSASRQSIAWPAIEGIVSPEAMAKAADHLTSRSLQWRARLEVGLVGIEAETDSAREAMLRDRLVWEVVVDIASERPRVAYLRDVTMEQAAGRLYETLIAGGEEPALEGMEENLESLLPETEAPPEPRSATSSLSFFETPAEVPGLQLPGLRPRKSLSFGPGLSASTSDRGTGARESSSPRADSGDLDWTGFDPAEEDDLLRMGPWELEPAEEEPQPGAGVDRRQGRWTSGRQGGVR